MAIERIDATEPADLVSYDPYVSETDTAGLGVRKNAVLTPHAAWYSEESRQELNRTVATDVVRVLRGCEPHNPVEPGTGR